MAMTDFTFLLIDVFPTNNLEHSNLLVNLGKHGVGSMAYCRRFISQLKVVTAYVFRIVAISTETTCA